MTVESQSKELSGYHQRVVSQIVLELIREGTLDRARVNDRGYILQMVTANIVPCADNASFIFTLHDEFLEAAREAVTAGRRPVAIVLLATAIEQGVNVFYRLALGTVRNAPETDITEVIRGSNIRPKLGWLMRLASGSELDECLINRVVKLMERRNQIVHYKAVPVKALQLGRTHFDDEIDPQDMEPLFQLAEELFAGLGDILDKMGLEHCGDDFKLAHEAIECLYGKSLDY